MRFSQILIPTTKETPNDASLVSHIYLIRAGFIQGYSSGLYNFLPLGKIVLDKVRAVVKDELDKAGAMEVSLGFVTPSSFWKESGRIEKYGKELLRFEDRHGAEFLLSPTNEESMVNLVKGSVKSYKNLPLNLYQINLKFRDEIRPRFGLMRGREFLMKDAYSFHIDNEDMLREFNLMEDTYSRIFTRLGLDFRIVEADSGAIGGSGSKEFMILADSGEDTIKVCESCSYGANIEVETGEVCPKCNSKLNETKGIEAGHIFQLGTQYSDALDANFLDNNGKAQPFVMGTYGIGVSRLLAGIIEQNHDDKGCIWTKESTPFSVEIIISNIKKEEEVVEATKLYDELKSKGIDVLLDDRRDRFGAKIKDFELIGIPTAVVIGKKLGDKLVEIVDRRTLEKTEIELDNLLDEVLKRV